MKMVPASGRNPEGFMFYRCGKGKLSDDPKICPPLNPDGVVIPAKELIDGVTGFWPTFKAYGKVGLVVGALVGLNTAKPTAFGAAGLTGIIPLSAFDQFKRAKFGQSIIDGAFRHACAHKILVDKGTVTEDPNRWGSEVVLRQYCDMRTDLTMMLLAVGAQMRLDKAVTKGMPGYNVDMSINDEVNRIHKETEEQVAKCAADPTACKSDDDINTDDECGA
jgi:hypothetical protein